ncbi:MAG TPA: hypothetical protein VFW62_05935, partial [bacterium]|nr:hypothetical protein [bacterium]
MKRLWLLLFTAATLTLPVAAQAVFPFDIAKETSGTPESAPSEAKKLPEEADIVKARDLALAEQQQVEQILASPADSRSDVDTQYFQARL